MALATGAASPLPLTSERAASDCSTITATATCLPFVSDFAYDVNQAYGVWLLFSPCWAVPVFPPTVAPAIRAFRAGALLHHRLHGGLQLPCGRRADDPLGRRVVVVLQHVPATVGDLRTMCAEASSPSWAIAAETMAICSGVAVTSNWPMPDSAVCALSMSDGYTLGYARTGTSCRSSLKPNFSAIALTLSWPRSTAILPKTLLQE